MPASNVAETSLKQGSFVGPKQKIKSVNFEKKSNVSGTGRFPTEARRIFSGFTSGDLINIEPAYRVIIMAKLGGGSEIQCITSVLQESTTLRITSDWEPFIPTGVSAVADTIFQTLGSIVGVQKSLVNRFTSRRIWRGTSPIELTMNLRFESVSDTFKNVIEPSMRLMQIASPSLEGLTGSVGLLSPPGPNVFQRASSIKADDKIKSKVSPGDVISIHVGTFLKFDSVIIKEVVPVFDNRMSPDGYPISAKVAVVFQTYEVLTKSDIRNRVFVKKPTINPEDF